MRKLLIAAAALALSALWSAPAMALADLSVSYDYAFDGTAEVGTDSEDLDSGSLLRAKVGFVGFVVGAEYFTGSVDNAVDITTTELKAGYGLGLVAADLDFVLVYNTNTWDFGGGDEVEWTSYGVGVDATVKAIPFILLEGYYTMFLATEVSAAGGVPLSDDEGTGSEMGIRATYNFFDGLGLTLAYRTQTNEGEFVGSTEEVTSTTTSLGLTYTF